MNDLAISRFYRSLTARAGVFLLFAGLALGATAGLAQAAVTLDVQPSGGSYNSIQDAIDAANITTNTVVIRVAEGYYHENIDSSGAVDLTIQGGWNSTFTNRDTARATVAHGDYNGSEIDISNSTVIIDGLTITRGNDSDGGGIDVYDSTLTIRNSKIVRNEADADGGGIDSNNTKLTIENSDVSHNMSWNDNDGGGLNVYGGVLVIRNSTISENLISDGGGNGGGLELSNTSATIENSRILNNTAFEGDGGGIYASYTDLLLVNTLVSGNSAMGYDGGGLYYSQYDGGDALTILNSTFANNTAEANVGSGGGVYVNSKVDGAVTVKNSVLWGNLDGSYPAPYFTPSDFEIYYDSGVTVDVSFSDIGATVGDAFTAGPGEISADPLYVNAATDDFHLRAGSPAINTATSVGAPITDLDGIARPQGAGFDMGAFEWVAPAVLDVTAPTATLTTPYISSNVKKNQDFDLSWSGADPAPSSGGLLFDVWYKIGNGGAWHRWLDWTATTGRRFRGLRGKTYYFKVKAKDAAGNVGAFSSESMTLVPFDGLLGNYIISRNGFYLNKWTKASNNNYGRTLRKSSAKGEQITYRYKKTNQINLIATLGKGHGKFKVLVDGVNKGVVDTKASTTQHRKIVFTVDFPSFSTHKIQVVNLGTPGRPTIEMDGIAVRR